MDKITLTVDLIATTVFLEKVFGMIVMDAVCIFIGMYNISIINDAKSYERMKEVFGYTCIVSAFAIQIAASRWINI